MLKLLKHYTTSKLCVSHLLTRNRKWEFWDGIKTSFLGIICQIAQIKIKMWLIHFGTRILMHGQVMG
jgi:hypothetical protein